MVDAGSLDYAMSDVGSEPPPSLPASEQQYMPPITRSELLENRRAESRAILQDTYDVWEAANPVWAQRLTGVEAAAALGIDTSEQPPGAGSRRALMQQRRVEARDLAMQSSGFSDAIQAQLRSHEPNQLHTSIARPTDDLTTSYVEAPRNRTRAELIKERNQAHLKALHATASHPGPDTNTRVQQRVDMGIQTQLTAPAGKSRAALLAARRQRRAAENEELAAAGTASTRRPPFQARCVAHGARSWRGGGAVGCSLIGTHHDRNRDRRPPGTARVAWCGGDVALP